MKTKSTKLTISANFEVYKSAADLSGQDSELLKAAQKAVKAAYAPYSNFCVGAAVLLENGKIVIGNNQENAAYPSGLCAERVAIFYAGAKHPGVAVTAIAIAVKAQNQIINDPVTPCGACRQAIAEYENRYETAIRIIMSGETGKVFITDSIESLLPLMFNRKHLT